MSHFIYHSVVIDNPKQPQPVKMPKPKTPPPHQGGDEKCNYQSKDISESRHLSTASEVNLEGGIHSSGLLTSARS